MALARIKTWIAETLKSADLNAEFNNILNNPISLVSPWTGTMDANSKQLLNHVLEKLAAAATPATQGRLYYRTDNNLPEFDTGTVIRTLPDFVYGGGRLTKSGANLLWSPLVHNLLPINGRLEVIPDAGITLAIGAAAASTTYYIYAFMSGATMTLEFSATAYAVQAGTGVPIKSGDATRTLVGLARTTAGPAWNDDNTLRGVLSYWNRRDIALTNNFTANRSTASTTYVELNTEIRGNFITWADEAVVVAVTGVAFISTALATMSAAISFDSTTSQDGGSMTSLTPPTVGGATNMSLTLQKNGLAEGFHFATLLGATSNAADAANFNGGTPSGSTVTNVSTLSVRVRG